jgi:hypothetical protein
VSISHRVESKHGLVAGEDFQSWRPDDTKIFAGAGVPPAPAPHIQPTLRHMHLSVHSPPRAVRYQKPTGTALLTQQPYPSPPSWTAACSESPIAAEDGIAG